MSDKKDLSPLDAAIRWRKEHPGWMGLDTSRHGNGRTWPKLKNKPIQVNLDTWMVLADLLKVPDTLNLVRGETLTHSYFYVTQ